MTERCCFNCGEPVDEDSSTDLLGRRVWLCDSLECERAMGDAEEQEYQDDIDEVNERHGR